jgi:RNA polymerase sigma-70 factor (ECF subfamily)
MVWEALEGLPSAFREIVVLREIDGMSYKEIATLANLPIGTVMSRLARARKRLQTSLAKLAGHRIGKRRHGAKGKRCSTVAGG